MVNVEFIRDEWLPALRSGGYTQGTSSLHNLKDDTWCCLGVACDLLAKQNLLPNRTEELASDNAVHLWGPEMYEGTLPTIAQEHLGISSLGAFTPVITNRGHTLSTLATLNDFANFTFDEIADVIEDILDPTTERRFLSPDEAANWD